MNEEDLTPLQKAHKVMAERRANGEVIVMERLDPLEKSKKNPKSRKLAIDAKCYECQGCSADPAVRWRIGNCDVGDECPLYSVRPYQKMLGRPTPVSLVIAMAITEESGVEVAVDDEDDLMDVDDEDDLMDVDDEDDLMDVDDED